MNSPFKPLYKPSLSDFERAIADIEDRVEFLECAVANITLEEQRQANWFKVEKKNEKKTTLIRYLLHSDEEFDEDDFSNAIPLMVKFLSGHSLDELQDVYQKSRTRVVMSKFHARYISPVDSSDGSDISESESFDAEEQCDYIADDTDGNSLNSWTDFEQPTYGLINEIPKAFRSLDSIEEEKEPSDAGSIYTAVVEPFAASFPSLQQASDTAASRSSDDATSQSLSCGDVTSQSQSTGDVRSCTSGDVTATYRSGTSSLSDINVDISEIHENATEEGTASEQNTYF